MLARDYTHYWHPLMSRSKNLDRMKIDPDMADEDVTPEYLIDALWIVGGPRTSRPGSRRCTRRSAASACW